MSRPDITTKHELDYSTLQYNTLDKDHSEFNFLLYVGIYYIILNGILK